MSRQHVLIIDDSPVHLRTLINLLHADDYRVSVASDGLEGIEAAKTRHPDIILMDVVMPGMNGFQATRQLSRYEETAHIPVIVCSSKSTDSDRLWALRQGAKDYLVKPIQQKELLAVINRELNNITHMEGYTPSALKSSTSIVTRMKKLTPRRASKSSTSTVTTEMVVGAERYEQSL